MERGRFPIKFALLWSANLAVLAAIYFLGDIQLPILINRQDIGKVIGGIALILALLESALISKIKGE